MALNCDSFVTSTLIPLSVLFSPFFFFLLLRSGLTGITTDNPLCCVEGLDRVTLEWVTVALGRDVPARADLRRKNCALLGAFVSELIL